MLALVIVLVAPARAAELRIGLIGNPNHVPEWTDEQVRALKAAGFNAVQLNVAWGARPQDEPLNLNDVVAPPGEAPGEAVARRAAELRKRVDLARRHGLRTIFHFGSPFMWRNPETGEVKRQSPEAFRGVWFDSADPRVVSYETSLLRAFVEQFGDVDDVLVYTYDQDAWQASQFSTSPLSRGVPLHERLPKYLATLHEVWTKRGGATTRADAGAVGGAAGGAGGSGGANSGGRGGAAGAHTFWWEPWELSAGQIYKIIPQLPTEQFGLIIHNNIAEVQIGKPVDLWYRTTARLCRDRGIPVVGEGYFSSQTEEVQALGIPCPRLVDEQIAAMRAVPGVVGLKEYFGVLPLRPDLNLAMFTARVHDPAATTDQLLDRITARFGDRQGDAKVACEELAKAMQMMPFEASWFVRLLSKSSIDHGWAGATIRGQMADTPSWNSTRAAMFMKTDDREPHPDMLEDVGLRCEIAAAHLAAAERVLPNLVERSSGADRAMFEALAKDVDHFRRVATSYALHLRETVVARILREDFAARRPMNERLVAEMKRLLAADVENQRGEGRVVQMRDAFDADPRKFVNEHLVPTEKTVLEKGHFTLTTR